MLNNYWLKFSDGSTGSCQGDTPTNAQVRAEQITGKRSTSVHLIPYPSSPVIWQESDPKYGPTPAFCYTPEECKGRTCCPKRYACTE